MTPATRTLLALCLVLAAMTGLAFASVPLYRIFCEVTGFGGIAQRAAAAPDQVVERWITVRFDANTGEGLGWQFQPVERQVRVKVGETALISYRATNREKQPVVGTATFNVTPLKAGPYFAKLECFCFTEQRLDPGESVDMPVSFFVDPALAADRKLDDLSTITLSYTFFRAARPQANGAPALGPNSPRS